MIFPKTSKIGMPTASGGLVKADNRPAAQRRMPRLFVR